MELQEYTVKIPTLLERLTTKQRIFLNELPRHERLTCLAEYLDRSESLVGEALAKECDLKFINHFKLIEKPTERIPLKLIHEFQCLPIESPISQNSSGLHLVTVWMPDAEMIQWIKISCGEEPIWYLTFPQNVSTTIIQNFGVGAGSLDANLEDLGEVKEENLEVEEDEDAAIIRFVNEIIAKAINDRATDIHFEPQKNSLQIRYRIDGQLVPVKLPENLVKFQAAIISRLKIMSRLNISEKRRPQDGRIRFTSGPIELDIRLSTLPTLYGESISLRLLNQGSRPLTLEDLGLLSEDLGIIDKSIRKPHGIVLVTGPTGSGKSTSLSAFVRRIRTPERRIVTVEDPVEYEIEGVNQSQVHSEIGFSFASALRHILRQDPDVIMIGEIRDKETADIAIRASLTGHLVLSSLHTNDAAGALTRLVDMGIEPFLVASSVELIIAQRLIRRLCTFCAKPAQIPVHLLKTYLTQLGIKDSHIPETIKQAQGCDQCRGLGYKDRIGIFEILNISEDIHQAIIQKVSARDIREIGLKEGMRTLQESGWAQIKRGLTTIEEVLHFATVDIEEA